MTSIAQMLTNPTFLVTALVLIASLGTVYSVVIPLLDRRDLSKRLRSVSVERDLIRQRERERERMHKSDKNSKATLRHSGNKKIETLVTRFNLHEALVDGNTVGKLKTAGLRSQNALNIFLTLRFLLPFGFAALVAFWIYGLGNMAEKAAVIRFGTVLGAATLGFYAPNIYVSNRIKKRQQSIKRAWPDALDLMLICVESGNSIEAGMRKVSEEMTDQSPELAEEMVLTMAELSFLQDRRSAYDNLATRTQLDGVKSLVQALIQAEKYGTPIGQALRVLAQDGRDERMNEAEKKAAALPPKLTVPMILFFLPVLVLVILGPAGIRVSDTF
jgi:tight adherence protein C